MTSRVEALPATATRRRVARAINPLGIGVIVVLVLLWQLVVVTKLVTFDYLPAPSAIAVALWQQLISGAMPTAIGHTLWITLVAALIAVVIGTIFGALLGSLRRVRLFSLASIDFLRSVPAVALMPVALLLLGPSPQAEIIVATYAALWPMILNTLGGVKDMNPRLSEVAQTLHINGPTTLRKIIIPAATPAILVGARLSVISALIVGIIAEMTVNPAGIGWALVQAQQALRPDVLFAYAVATGIVGVILNEVLVRGTRALMPGSPGLAEIG